MRHNITKPNNMLYKRNSIKNQNKSADQLPHVTTNVIKIQNIRIILDFNTVVIHYIHIVIIYITKQLQPDNRYNIIYYIIIYVTSRLTQIR